MTVFSLLIRCLSLAAILTLALTGCGPSIGNNAQSGASLQNTPTATPTVLALAAAMEETEPPPKDYSIEIRMPYELDQSTVIAEPGEGNVCYAELPFQVVQEGDRNMAHGSIEIECLYTMPHDPLPYTVHLADNFEASFDGEVFPPNESYPEGWIDGYLNINGTTTQYYDDFTMDVPNLCPESSPCTIPGTNVFSLPFHLVDGDLIEQGWIFILHIK